MRTLSVMIWLALAGLAVAQVVDREPVATMTRLETVKGRTYEEVRVMTVTASELRIVHKEGAASVRLADLSAEMQGKFAFDPVAGAAADAREAESQAKVEAAWEAKESAEDAKLRAGREKRAAAVKAVRDSKYGGRTYWQGSSNWRVRMDVSAGNKLRKGGFSDEESKKILHEMREAGKRQPAPENMHPAFRPRANTEALRSLPMGMRDKGGIKKPGGP